MLNLRLFKIPRVRQPRLEEQKTDLIMHWIVVCPSKVLCWASFFLFQKKKEGATGEIQDNLIYCISIKYISDSFLAKRTEQGKMGSSDFSCKEILYCLFLLLFQFSQSSLEGSPNDICEKLYNNNSFICLPLNVKCNYPVPSQSILPLFKQDLKNPRLYHRMNDGLLTAYLLSVQKKV